LQYCCCVIECSMATSNTVDHRAQSSCGKQKSHPTLCSRLVPLSSAISTSLQCTQNISHTPKSSCMTTMVTSSISLARKLFTCRKGAFVASLEAILAMGTTLNLSQVACNHVETTQQSGRCTQTSSAVLIWRVLLHTEQRRL